MVYQLAFTVVAPSFPTQITPLYKCPLRNVEHRMIVDTFLLDKRLVMLVQLLSVVQLLLRRLRGRLLLRHRRLGRLLLLPPVRL
jgi:hypothetical protein